MADIGQFSASVTALHKFYHTDTSKFYTATSTAGEYADEFFAVTVHSTTQTNQAIMRFVRSSGGTWIKTVLLDTRDSGEIDIEGSATGTFQRLGDKVYYTNSIHDVLQIRPRTSSGESNADYIHKAGLPDPNAEKVISRCEETAGWTSSTNSSGLATAGIDRSPLHRLQGRASLWFAQQCAGRTSTLEYAQTANIDLTLFSDGTTSTDSDFIALELFRFKKGATDEILMYASSGEFTTNYYKVPLVVTGETTLHDGTTWKNYHYRQTTMVAGWSMNPHDNQLFRVRIRKSWFEKVGSPNWSQIRKFKVTLKASSQANSANLSKVCIDNVRLLRTPPIAEPFKIQFASFERQECGSTTGWTIADSATAATFNNQFTREGVWCMKVSQSGTVAGAATASHVLVFDTAKNFAVFPDGSTVSNSDILKVNCTWKGPGYLAGWTNWNDWTITKYRFEDSSGSWTEVTFGWLENLLGGGNEAQIKFSHDGTATHWAVSTPAIDWKIIKKIYVTGPKGPGTPEPYFVDNLRLERPEAMMPINIFEPIELMIIDAATEWLSANFKDFAWFIELAGAIGSWIFKYIKYRTYGMGHATYPDYEHSSIGIAGCTLNAYGSKPFGMLLRHNWAQDLTNFKIFSFNWPPAFKPAPPDNEWGVVKFVNISAGVNDRFAIWMASPDARTIKEVNIKIHPNDGTNEPDESNYWVYTIPGSQIQAKLASQKIKDIQTEKDWEMIKRAFEGDIERKEDIITLYGTFKNPSMYGEVKEFVTDTIKYLGKDRGGWPSAIFEWKRSDFDLNRNQAEGVGVVDFDMSDIRGHSIEVVSNGGNATICVDNFIMVKEGALRGTFHYKVALEDDEGFLSPTSEPSIPVKVEKKDIVLTNVYKPSPQDLKRIYNKVVFRIGGMSTEWLRAGDMDPLDDDFHDNIPEANMGLIMPEDAYAPPKAKIMRRIGNCMYYGNVTDRLGNKLPYRVYKSEPFCAFRVSDFACIDIPETKGSGVTGIEEYYNHVVIWTSDSMWTAKKGLSTPIFRSKRGCIAPKSVDISEYGMIWLSRDGLMIGNISGVNDKFFRPVNKLFESYTETELSEAIGVVVGHFYYLFYQDKGIVCNLQDGLFSELEGNAFDVKSICKWDGRDDYNDIYYGRSNGRIFKMFSGDDDDGTAITTEIITKDFSTPGIQFEKFMKVFYVSMAKLGTANATLAITPYADQSAKTAFQTITATSTTISTFAEKSQQGIYGTHLGVKLTGTNRHKITQMLIKTKTEEDAEYLP